MELAYREYGAGRPMIILHGLFGQSDNWNTLARRFGEHYRVFAVDQRNHGLSPHSEKWDYPSMANDLSAFIAKLGIEKPLLVGHSMGAKTVLFFESLFPGTASSVVIADMAARAYPPHHADVLAALQSVDLASVKTRKDAETVLSARITDYGTKQFLLKNLHWKADNRLEWRFNLRAIRDSYSNILVAVPPFKSQVPALIVRGGNSQYVTDEDIADFRERFPVRCDVVTIEGAGHWVHAEKPDAFFNAVMEFTASPGR